MQPKQLSSGSKENVTPDYQFNSNYTLVKHNAFITTIILMHYLMACNYDLMCIHQNDIAIMLCLINILVTVLCVQQEIFSLLKAYQINYVVCITHTYM